MSNLISIKRNVIMGNPEIKLIRDGDYNVNLVISFDAVSRPNDGSGTDDRDTIVEQGDLQPSGPLVSTVLNDGTKTRFFVSLRVESKKPSTSGGTRTKSLLESLDDKDFVSSFEHLR